MLEKGVNNNLLKFCVENSIENYKIIVCGPWRFDLNLMWEGGTRLIFQVHEIDIYYEIMKWRTTGVDNIYYLHIFYFTISNFIFD